MSTLLVSSAGTLARSVAASGSAAAAKARSSAAVGGGAAGSDPGKPRLLIATSAAHAARTSPAAAAAVPRLVVGGLVTGLVAAAVAGSSEAAEQTAVAVKAAAATTAAAPWRTTRKALGDVTGALLDWCGGGCWFLRRRLAPSRCRLALSRRTGWRRAVRVRLSSLTDAGHGVREDHGRRRVARESAEIRIGPTYRRRLWRSRRSLPRAGARTSVRIPLRARIVATRRKASKVGRCRSGAGRCRSDIGCVRGMARRRASAHCGG
ncbi:hypothetical protein FrEUN1fDRAFT_0920 [Parafrankia sp. EUN1f]|nr:hypothetical protein FrEUN1fDRAFT_0920 [Parafrankia sp. EUN1f]